MDSHTTSPFDPDASNDPAQAMRWLPLVMPLATVLILALVGLV